MKAAVIVGSQRANSESGKVAKYIMHRCQALTGHKPFLLDLGKTPLELWDEASRNGGGLWPEASKKISDSDALVIITPEWLQSAPRRVAHIQLQNCE